MFHIDSRLLTAVLFLAASSTVAQSFSVVSDTANAITVSSNWVSAQRYVGAAWIDFDGDNDLDLATGRNELYRNLGNGRFQKVTTSFGSSALTQGESGMTWGDYDNDGDLDVYLIGLRSDLYRNDNGVFNRVTTGVIGQGSSHNAWSGAWGDYDNDGFLDLVLAAPFGFNNITTPNFLFHNNGDGSFTRIDTGAVVSQTAPYTVPSWYDHDQDGDIDLFIGSGPANGTIAADFFYKNMLVETGSAVFARMTTDNFATEGRDGQNVNWIDYDNDGDMDVFVSNYRGNTNGFKNSLFRNDGGSFTKITSGTLVSDADWSLGNLWEDFDNDGYLDCFITNEGGLSNRYYRNNGDGTFTRLENTGLTVGTAPHTGSSAGDYDQDGDLDLYVWSTPGGNRRLYRNESPAENHRADFKLVGTTSNRSSIGAVIRIKATIDGQPMWQTRELSAQNTFMGQNSLFPHFGLGDATIMDSVVVRWPSGLTKTLTNVAADQFIVLQENASTEVPPLFLKPAVASTYADNLFSLKLQAGAVPSAVFRFLQSPAPMTLDSLTGHVTWLPTSADVGSHPIHVEAINSAGRDTLIFMLEVLPFTAPSFEPIPDRVLFVGTLYSDTLTPSGSPSVTLSLLEAPTGMWLDAATGVLAWIPTVTSTATVRVVGINAAGVDTLMYDISVVAKPQMAVLQNPALPKYAELVMTSVEPLLISPTVRIGGMPAGTMELISGSDRSYRFPLEFSQTATVAMEADAISPSGYAVVIAKSFGVVLAGREEAGSWKRDDLSPEVSFDKASFAAETYVLVELDSLENELNLKVSAALPLVKSFRVTLPLNKTLFDKESAIAMPVSVRNGKNEVVVSRLGEFRIVSSDRAQTRPAPTSVRLVGNFPNPFNPSTTIAYTVPVNEFIDVAVYNLLGQRVKTLFRGMQSAGEHSLRWNATNESGDVVASGVYLVRIKSTSGFHTQKVLFTK